MILDESQIKSNKINIVSNKKKRQIDRKRKSLLYHE